MKKIFLLLLVFISFNSFAQDSSAIRINGIILKGKDFKVVSYFCMLNPAKFPVLDSFVKAVNFPADGDDVTFNNIPNRQWLRMFNDFKTNQSCLLTSNNNFKRLDDELRLHGSVWIIWRLNNALTDDDLINTNIKKAGASYAKKDDNEN